MLSDILPNWLYELIDKNFLYEYVYEIRIRNGKPIMLNYKGRYVEIKDNQNYSKGIIVGNQDLITYILAVATKSHSFSWSRLFTDIPREILSPYFSTIVIKGL